MDSMRIRDLLLHPEESEIEGLERAYKKYKNNPPIAVEIAKDDEKQIWYWEDIAILHFLPTLGTKKKYYLIVETRDGFFNKDCSIEEMAKTINYCLSQNFIE